MSSYAPISCCHSASETTDEAARQGRSLDSVSAGVMRVHVICSPGAIHRRRGGDQLNSGPVASIILQLHGCAVARTRMLL